ncbi:MAG: DoxX family protein [Mycobacterium sp.]|uniref:DoxX family protein n=1 Tax=Mycobacterium sp. TaxID=1785 RepID=UPI003CC629D2
MSTRHNTEQGIDMAAVTDSQTLSARSVRARLVAYWIVTGLLASELVLGGIWDILRIPLVRDVVTHVGYPTYLLVLLGVWKLLGAAALLAPRLPLLKEWAYAGAFFVFSGAIVSHLTTGNDLHELGFLVVLLLLIAASWTLRPATRRLGSSAGEQGVSPSRPAGAVTI